MIIQYKVGEFPLKVGSGKFEYARLYRSLFTRQYRCTVEGTDIKSKWYSRPDFAVSNARWLCVRAVEKAKNEQKQSTAN